MRFKIKADYWLVRDINQKCPDSIKNPGIPEFYLFFNQNQFTLINFKLVALPFTTIFRK